jgi:hypothetical protein
LKQTGQAPEGTVVSVTESPFDLPPGPERRAAMALEVPQPNIAPEDFSDEEREFAEQLPQILAGMMPIKSLYENRADAETP